MQPSTAQAFVKWAEGISLGLNTYLSRHEILTQNVHMCQKNRTETPFLSPANRWTTANLLLLQTSATGSNVHLCLYIWPFRCLVYLILLVTSAFCSATLSYSGYLLDYTMLILNINSIAICSSQSFTGNQIGVSKSFERSLSSSTHPFYELSFSTIFKQA